ncbi:hypothetical protein Ddye_024666 [Dipteronia dyeriana]|uniref:Uncharacterized protein n=1 Tax=Dipteronia dyeriana TaxID=168575 RepID=A0AAD9WUE5_9ROSI|nr:hypothetical protein Ddye_024666 [Dipteronia dyeriana]
MDTGLRQLIKFPSLRMSRNSSNSNASWRETPSFVEDHHDLRYISLKDIILNSPTPTCYSTNLLEGGSDFINSSNISIRNELVKRAASAYIQSSTILVTRNENYFASFWGNIRNRAQTYLFWNDIYEIRHPLRSCFRHVYRLLAHTVEIVWNGVVRMS